MFVTFQGSSHGTSTARPKPPKPKRVQVHRACDACRLARVKCDLTRPCRNCKQANRACVSSGGQTEFKTLASATTEIERLRARVAELEATQQSASALIQSPPISETLEGQCQTQPQTRANGREPWKWKGINRDGITYGPFSLPYFASRVADYTNLDCQLPLPPDAALNPSFADLDDCDRLQRRHQDYFLDLFWSVYYYSSPVIDEQAFRELYASLWNSDDSKRTPHPLVDIVLALTIQYAYSFMPRDDATPGFIQEQGSIAGSPFYHRSQTAIKPMLESPSLMTVQCMYFSTIYLGFARCPNAAYTMLKSAEQVANIVADQEDPQSQGLLIQSRICIRLIDMKLSIKLGRPMPANPITANRDFPAEDQPQWLLFQEQILRLSETIRDIYNSFMDQCNQLLETRKEEDIYVNSQTRDDTAAIMRQQMRKLDDWVAQVPSALKLSRRGHGEAFSTQRPHLDLGESVPQWLQRQRIALECHYHDFCTSLFRIFIAFSPTPERGTFNADGNCISSVNHAVAMTCIISQAMRDTDILTGCYQAFDWQHNAAFTLAGFAAGYPVCAPTPTARKALASAREVFGIPCAGGLAAAKMEALCQEFDEKIAEIISNFKQGLGIESAPVSKTPVADSTSSITISGATPADPPLDGDKQPMSFDALWDTNMDNTELWEWDQIAPMDEDLWSRLLGDFDGDKSAHD